MKLVGLNLSQRTLALQWCKKMGEKRNNKIEIELEKLKLIADYYELPLAVFFMSIDELKELKAKEGMRMKAIRKELEKLERIREIIRGKEKLLKCHGIEIKELGGRNDVVVLSIKDFIELLKLIKE